MGLIVSKCLLLTPENLLTYNVSGQYNLLIAAAVFSNPYEEPSQYMQNVMVKKEKSDL